MTIGGTGDVLSGISGAFLAQRIPPLESAVAAAFINGVAGDIAVREKGYRIEPGDLIEKIPYVIEDALQGRLRTSYGYRNFCRSRFFAPIFFKGSTGHPFR
tara:strand:- start:339 stop:641 length:303 start_codon:yes stop_codon:yes gene_type:complete